MRLLIALVAALVTSPSAHAQDAPRVTYIKCLFTYAWVMSKERGQAAEIADAAFATCRRFRDGVVRSMFIIPDGPLTQESLDTIPKSAEAGEAFAADLDARARGLLIDAVLRLRAGIASNPGIADLSR